MRPSRGCGDGSGRLRAASASASSAASDTSSRRPGMATERRENPSIEHRLVLRLGILSLFALLFVSGLYFAAAWNHRHVDLAQDMGELAIALGTSAHRD